MGIETKYKYIYYTVIVTEDWLRGNEHLLGEDAFSWNNACKFINTKFEKNTDGNTCFKVSEAHYCDDIECWHHRNMQHKQCPVFVRFQDDQPIMTTGQGYMFVLYVEDYAEDEEDAYSTCPDDENY